MAKKSKKAGINNYSKILHILASIKDPKRAISYLKSNHNRNETEKYFSQLLKVTYYKQYLVGTLFPKKYKEIETEKYTYISDIETEIWWTTIAINAYSEEINNFLKLSQEFYDLLLHGYYEKANEILLQIELEYGISVWLIENKIILYAKFFGLNKQKEYASETSSLLPPVLGASVYYLSQKLENELSYEQFNKNFNIFWANYPELKEISSQICNPLVNKTENLVSVLHDESARTIIDRYLTLKKVISSILIDDNKYGIPIEQLQNHLLKLLLSIKDNELLALLHSISFSKCEDINENAEFFVKALDYYTIGEYKYSYEICNSLLNSKAHDYFGIIELLVKSEIRCNENLDLKIAIDNESILFQIYTYVKSILKKDDLITSSINRLLKISIEFSNFPIGSRILLFINKELPFIKQSISEQSLLLAKQSSFTHDIRNIDFLSPELKDHWSMCYLKKYSNSITYKLYTEAKNEQILFKDIPKYRVDKYKAKIINACPIPDKVTIFKELIDEGNLLDKYEAINILSNMYFEIGKIENCTEIIVNGYLLNNNLIYSLPINKITKYIDKNHEFAFDKNIDIPILYGIYSKFVSSDLDSKKSIRYEAFLEAYGYTRPRDLINEYEKFASNKVNFFLQYICVIHVMDSSMHFSSTKEIEDERIYICQFLISQCPDSKLVLSNEIKEITENSLISESLLEIEQNKIYANTEGIKNHLSPQLKEYYLRFMNLLQNTKNLKNKFLLSGMLIHLPDNDLIELVLNALNEVRDHFVFSNEYGLNGYLSTNIRHGTLFNYLRSSLVSNKIITQKDIDRGEYKENEYWKEYYSNQDAISISFLLKALNEFSENVDTIIYRLRNDYIQIYSESKQNKGLFNYSLTEYDANEIIYNLTQESTYDEFVNAIFSLLWDRTEYNLRYIRHTISTEIAIGFKNVFTDLITKLEDIKTIVNISELRDTIASESTYMQTKIDDVKSWFTRQTASDIKDFKFYLPINIAEKMIKNVNANIDIEIHKQIQIENLFSGVMLKNFVDILYILFDNAIKYVPKEDRIISVIFENSDRQRYSYKLIVINTVDDNTIFPLVEQKLLAIEETIKNKLFGQNVSSEGGTGFYKIVKILKYDLQFIDPYIHFGFNEKNQFAVEIHFNV